MSTGRRHDDDNDFRRQARRLLWAWIALILLLLSSLGSAYLPLGPVNPAISIGIALLKSAIVVWLFMRMNRASALVRIAAASAIGALVLLAGLSGVDYATRAQRPAVVQQPQQLAPLLQERRK